MENIENDVALEEAIVQELNNARQNPASVCKALRERLPRFKGKEYRPPDRSDNSVIVSKEGPVAVRDAIAYLSKPRSVCELSVDGPDGPLQGMRLAADDHRTDLGGNGTVGHQGADGSHSHNRMERYGGWSGKCGECLWFGRKDASASTIVEDLIVDDGVPDRGHRTGIYDSKFRVVGVRWGPHKTFGACCVIVFASGYVDDQGKVSSRFANGPPKLPASAAKAGAIKTQWKLGRCPGCQEDIHGGSVLEALGKKWHVDCFVCQAADCRRSLRGVPFQKHGADPYCADCFFETFGETCAECGKKIHGGVMKCRGQTFHRECVDANVTVVPKFNPQPRTGATKQSNLAVPAKAKASGSRAVSAPRGAVPSSPPRLSPRSAGPTGSKARASSSVGKAAPGVRPATKPVSAARNSAISPVEPVSAERSPPKSSAVRSSGKAAAPPKASPQKASPPKPLAQRPAPVAKKNVLTPPKKSASPKGTGGLGGLMADYASLA